MPRAGNERTRRKPLPWKSTSTPKVARVRCHGRFRGISAVMRGSPGGPGFTSPGPKQRERQTTRTPVRNCWQSGEWIPLWTHALISARRHRGVRGHSGPARRAEQHGRPRAAPRAVLRRPGPASPGQLRLWRPKAPASPIPGAWRAAIRENPPTAQPLPRPLPANPHPVFWDAHPSSHSQPSRASVSSSAVELVGDPQDAGPSPSSATDASHETDYVVIGSGIGGLCAAAVLALRGNRVTVCESHYAPGGAAHAFRVRGPSGTYVFESGPSFHAGLSAPLGQSKNPLRQARAGGLEAVMCGAPCVEHCTHGKGGASASGSLRLHGPVCWPPISCPMLSHSCAWKLLYGPSTPPCISSPQVLDLLGESVECKSYRSWSAHLPEGRFDFLTGGVEYTRALREWLGDEAARQWAALEAELLPLVRGRSKGGWISDSGGGHGGSVWRVGCCG